MLPAALSTASFDRYPPLAQQVANAHLVLLQQLPLIFAPILLREIISYDWKFPIEQRELDGQLQFLTALSPDQRTQLLSGMARLNLPPGLAATGWVNAPAAFMEQLTASLWATHQMDAFREAATSYAKNWRSAQPQTAPAMPRLVLIAFSPQLIAPDYPLFRKLRPRGTLFTHFDPTDALPIALQTLQKRAALHPEPYAHWYVDGHTCAPTHPSLTTLDYNSLAPARVALLDRVQSSIQAGASGPESVRSLMAATTPKDLGLEDDAHTATLSRFKVSLLTEGSGTQIFSTSFVEWAARESLRRAQPTSLIARFAPRQAQRSMNDMLSGSSAETRLDPSGSLIDADMAAYYTRINQQRLPGTDQSLFIAWSEAHAQAIAIGSGLPRATVSTTDTNLAKLLNLLS